MLDLPTSAARYQHLWTLDPAITFLNHGSYGACPRLVQEKQTQLRQQMEAEPVQFLGTELEGLLDQARSQLAHFVGADPANLAFIPNATTGVNTVLRSLCLQPGDELLTTDHEYNACRNALNRVAELTGARVVVAELAFPLESASQVVEAVLNRVSARTRLLLMDHVTSQTALILPIGELIQRVAAQGIETLIDGAHAPGMVPLNLQELGAAYYTGNCHKWMCSPKGAAFLYVRDVESGSSGRRTVRPLVISHGANAHRPERSLFHLEFDWMGTADPTPYLCVPTAIEFLGSLLPGGWAALRSHNHATVLAGRDRLHQLLNDVLGITITPTCPPEMLGSMAVISLPEGKAAPLQDRLFQEHRIEVPVMPWQRSPYRLLRISAQIYNTAADYDQLGNALVALLHQEHHQA